MRHFIALALTPLLAGIAQASTPIGAQHGPWHVTSITSLSGVAGDDAMALIVQENRAGRIGVDWRQGSDVVISLRVQACQADGGDFVRSHGISPTDWAHTPVPALTRRLEGDFSAWLAEARQTCRRPGRLGAFRLRMLTAAVTDFTAQLRYLGSIE